MLLKHNQKHVYLREQAPPRSPCTLMHQHRNNKLLASRIYIPNVSQLLVVHWEASVLTQSASLALFNIYNHVLLHIRVTASGSASLRQRAYFVVPPACGMRGRTRRGEAAGKFFQRVWALQGRYRVNIPLLFQDYPALVCADSGRFAALWRKHQKTQQTQSGCMLCLQEARWPFSLFYF